MDLSQVLQLLWSWLMIGWHLIAAGVFVGRFLLALKATVQPSKPGLDFGIIMKVASSWVAQRKKNTWLPESCICCCPSDGHEFRFMQMYFDYLSLLSNWKSTLVSVYWGLCSLWPRWWSSQQQLKWPTTTEVTKTIDKYSSLLILFMKLQ